MAGLSRTIFRVLVYAMSGLGLLFLTVTFTPVVKVWSTALAGPWDDPDGDVLIVLGGSGAEDGILGQSSYWRSRYALSAFRESHFKKIFISGGGSPTPVAAEMAQFIQCQGIPKEVIFTELESTSTRENALYTAVLLAKIPGRKVLLTSDYHMYRARRAFQKAGVSVVPRPFPDVRKRAARLASRWPAFLDLAGETSKIAYYYYRDWI
jgi:uncharacterized SAM-binding protein YcdF (DUF218 family)